MINISRLWPVIALLLVPAAGLAEETKPPHPSEVEGARFDMTVEPAQTVRIDGYSWDHQYVVALPATYAAQPDRTYPTLWVTDSPLMFRLTVGLVNLLSQGSEIPEMIVVGVGLPGELETLTYGRRRWNDFGPPGAKFFFDGVSGKVIEEMMRAYGLGDPPQTADVFLSFLVDELRPMLSAKYRMSDDHALFGHSAGGLFTAYAMVARPLTFKRYIIGSPVVNMVDRVVFRLEEKVANENDDLPINVFFGAGEDEIDDYVGSAWGIVSSPILLAETLRLRKYPSIKIRTRVFPGKNHFTVVPDVIADGLRFVYAEPEGDADAE